MRYTRLGSSDLKVSRICMGCMGFGNPATGQHNWTLGETESREIITGVDAINLQPVPQVFHAGSA